ncbi:hypothetical protein ACOME3_000723 [Neoechinorhynchus agilis]
MNFFKSKNPNLMVADLMAWRTIIWLSEIRSASTIKLPKLPIDWAKQLDDAEIKESFVRGSGPGGQNVNKTNNAVHLRHVPTGAIVKCHSTRSLEKNRELARHKMLLKLDEMENGEMSLSARLKREAEINRKQKDKKSKKRLERVKEFKRKMGIDS